MTTAQGPDGALPVADEPFVGGPILDPRLPDATDEQKRKAANVREARFVGYYDLTPALREAFYQAALFTIVCLEREAPIVAGSDVSTASATTAWQYWKERPRHLNQEYARAWWKEHCHEVNYNVSEAARRIAKERREKFQTVRSWLT